MKAVNFNKRLKRMFFWSRILIDSIWISNSEFEIKKAHCEFSLLVIMRWESSDYVNPILHIFGEPRSHTGRYLWRIQCSHTMPYLTPWLFFEKGVGLVNVNCFPTQICRCPVRDIWISHSDSAWQPDLFWARWINLNWSCDKCSPKD